MKDLLAGQGGLDVLRTAESGEAPGGSLNLDDSVFATVYEVVRSIPAGRVMSYGMVGQLAGCTPRVVGWAMANVPDGVPWHRVVGADGGLPLAKRSPDGAAEQRARLLAEGVAFSSRGNVDMERARFGVEDTDTLG